MTCSHPPFPLISKNSNTSLRTQTEQGLFLGLPQGGERAWRAKPLQLLPQSGDEIEPDGFERDKPCWKIAPVGRENLVVKVY